MIATWIPDHGRLAELMEIGPRLGQAPVQRPDLLHRRRDERVQPYAREHGEGQREIAGRELDRKRLYCDAHGTAKFDRDQLVEVGDVKYVGSPWHTGRNRRKLGERGLVPRSGDGSDHAKGHEAERWVTQNHHLSQ